MKAATGAIPLKALDAVAFDTETTGLDTAHARIVQIAGIAISHGAIRESETFETFVDPSMDIAPSSTAIHGIDGKMVAGAPTIGTAHGAFETFRNKRILVGYSVGFDFAILKREAERAGFSWSQPRSLCVRLLGTIANPTLPDESLETLASWLMLDISGRHTAIGDARAAAAIFLRLLPSLEKRGIRTLAEAERACLQLTEQLGNHRRAGWETPVTPPQVSRLYADVDPYAYRHRVGEIMSHPVAIIPPDTTTGQAIADMVEKRISSVLVSGEAQSRAVSDYGILTERDVMRHLAKAGPAALHLTVGEIASRPLVTIADEAFVYRAMGRMERHRIRHLAVRDKDNQLKGIVSARDLLKLRGGAAIRLDDAIEAARTSAEMARAWAMLPEVTERLIDEGIDARIVAGIISEELRVLTRRAAVLAEAAMVEAGQGAPPCAYALLVLGSGGRGESLLAADQDNAIVYEDDAAGGCDAWFAELGKRVADALDTAGIPYCKGGVMAMNPPWRGSLATWLKRVNHWIGRSEPQDLLNVDIFFDMRPVHGSQALGAALFESAYHAGHAHPPFAKFLGDRLGDFGSPFGLFGRLRLVEGRIDLKKYGLFPIVAFARALAIRHDLRVRRTEERIEGLMALDIGGKEDLRAILDGHAQLLALLLAQQSRDLHDGIPVSNRVEAHALTPGQEAELKIALHAVERIPNLFRSLVTARSQGWSSTSQ
ncbi:DUF294 nucleotidyltransferase-like domain-containing protein [Pararhizobium haloflavum]|uniref:DUF294 nucleotidyltransferase-like domain-containing protein n=1 Tax=Pararhizobium haloflavum TaxID=2037914 RepID=UPI000C186ED5|nr:DUF294 nucleotidyltransferase-like domain-containing protein [Pararhizobium haloflavum]